jgi:hypothetical protein
MGEGGRGGKCVSVCRCHQNSQRSSVRDLLGFWQGILYKCDMMQAVICWR